MQLGLSCARKNDCPLLDEYLLNLVKKSIYLFLVLLGPCCCTWAFSKCGQWGNSSCSGFSCRAWALDSQASGVTA